MRRKNRFAFFGGAIVPIEEAKIGVMTSGLHYGTGVFEGIRAYWNEERQELLLFRLEEHFERFLRNCRVLLMDIPYTARELCEVTVELLRREEFRTDTYVRPLAYKSSEVIGVRLHDVECACAVFAVPFGPYLDTPDGARLMTSSWRRINDTAIPARGKFTGAYVNSALAKSEACLGGFDDALMLTQSGHVSEASAANFFLAREGALATPPVTDNILEGIRRRTFMEIARGEGIDVVERSIDRSELFHADEAFLCGTGVGIVPVVEVDRRAIGNGRPGPITTRLRDRYESAVRGNDPAYVRHCTPVYGPREKVRPESATA